MSRWYLWAEREHIGKLVSEGLTNREIAQKLGRTEAAVRNMRYQEGLKIDTKNQLPTLTTRDTAITGNKSANPKTQSSISKPFWSANTHGAYRFSPTSSASPFLLEAKSSNPNNLICLLIPKLMPTISKLKDRKLHIRKLD